MGLTQAIAAEAGVHLIIRGALELVPHSEAVRFLKILPSKEVLVLGIEAFFVRPTEVTPDMDAIADYSDLIAANDAVWSTVECSIRFVQTRGRLDHYYHFTLKGFPRPTISLDSV